MQLNFVTLIATMQHKLSWAIEWIFTVSRKSYNFVIIHLQEGENGRTTLPVEVQSTMLKYDRI